MPMTCCNFCPHTEPDCGYDCGCHPKDHQNSSKRIMNHMIDKHAELLEPYYMQGIPPDQLPGVMAAFAARSVPGTTEGCGDA